MFLEAIILGMVLGVIRKGRFTNLFHTKIKGWYLILLSFFIQILPLFSDILTFIKPYIKYSYVSSMVLIFIVIIINLDKKGMYVFLVGAILNLLVVVMNDFKMPIHFDGLRLTEMEYMIEAIKNGTIINYMSLDNVTDWTKHLGKFIVIPRPYPLAKVISAGDIFMSLGIILFIQGQMTKSYLMAKSRMVRLGYKTKI